MGQVDNQIGAVDTTFKIIESLEDQGPAGITELADRIGSSKSTVFNHLNTLEENGLVFRDGEQSRLSLRFLELGEHVRRDIGVYRVGRPVVDGLATETGEVANILIPENGQGVYIYKALGEEAISHDTYPGKRIFLHCTALGKSILSEMSRDKVDAIIDQHGLKEMTNNTITDRDALYEELAEIREQGYASNVGERYEQVHCIATPILLGDDVRGAISVSGPKTRMKNPEKTEEIAEQVQEAANVIEINLEHN